MIPPLICIKRMSMTKERYFITMQNASSGLLSMERQLACYAAAYEYCVLPDKDVDKVVLALQKRQERLLAENPRWKSVTISKSYWPNGNVCVRIGNYEMRGVIVNNTPEDANQ